MKTIRLLLIVTTAGLLLSCDSTRPVQTASIPPSRQMGGDIITRSLFDSKDRTISEEDIQRLLDGTITLRDTVRVAVIKYGATSINRYYTAWSIDEEYLKTQQRFVDTLIYQIRRAGKVSKVIPVPALMAAPDANITQLRETAVRLQADLLLVYSVTSDIYFRYKVFRKNEAKAFATCEAILLDTRTGVVPFSSIVTKEKLMVKNDDDPTDVETRKKAEREAVLLSLVETGSGISRFLNSR